MPKRAAAKQAARPHARAQAEASTNDERKRSFGTIVAQVGGAASAIAAILGIVFVLAPDLAPEKAPTEKRAQIGVLKVERPVTYAQYLQRTGLPGGDYGRSYLRRSGVFVEFDVEIVGYEGTDLPLRWSLYDADSGDQVSESKSTTLRAEAPNERATWHVWAPLPKRRGKFFLQLQLFEGDDIVPLDRVQTEPFPGLSKEQP